MPDTPHDAPPAGRGHREGTKVELRRLDAVHLYLRGHYKAEIGRRLGVDRRTVRRDIDAVRAEWKAERITTFEAAVDEVLARVGAVEVEAWAAWERSKQERETKTAERIRDEHGTARLKARTVTEPGGGNPAFLDRVAWCIEQRARIVGAYAPQKIAATDEQGRSVIPFDHLRAALGRAGDAPAPDPDDGPRPAAP